MIEYISSPNSPAPKSPYSPAVRAGDFIFVSGQAVLGDVQSATREILTNIRAVLEAGGASLADVVRCGVYLMDAEDFQAMNAAYGEMFGSTRPARSTIIVAALPLPGALVEIDCVAYKPR
jgi:2-iminobutanoate/2-iminopropanoate deaminase